MKFNLFNINFYISFIVVAFFSIMVLLDKSGNLICCFTAAVLHELGHIVAMCLCNCKPIKIVFKLFDIRIINNNRYLCSYSSSMFIVIAGVLVNFALCCISYCFWITTQLQFFQIFSLVNLFTGLFNLLPVSNLDGGQALFLLLQRKFSEKTTDSIIDILTVLLILPTAILGFIVLFRSKYNFSLLIISFYLLLALVLKKSKYY